MIRRVPNPHHPGRPWSSLFVSCALAGGVALTQSACGSDSAPPDAPATLPTQFRWTSTGPLIAPVQDRFHPILSIKDPTVVQFEQRWHLFATTADTTNMWSMVYLSFGDWSEAASAQPYYLDDNPALTGYHAAPQVFFFRPRNEWYLVFQSGQPQYSTTDDLSDPESWSAPQDFFPGGEPAIVAENKGDGGWLDFWVICDAALCHLFFTDDNGHLYRSQTAIDSFPRGFGEPVIAIDGTKASLFEGSATYKVGTNGGYLTLVEAFDDAGGRYYRSFVADTLDGEWSPLADSLDNPFAAASNVSFGSGTAWTREISHGELLRAGHDESLTIDPAQLHFLYQGMDPAQSNLEYFQRPYRLGLLTLEGHEPLTDGSAPDPSAGGAGGGPGNPDGGGEVLIDVAAMPPTFLCYDTAKQFLSPFPATQEQCPATPNVARVDVSEEDGDPPPSLRFEIPFTDYSQLVDLEWAVPIAHENMTGKLLVLRLEVVEPGFTNPMCPGGVRFFVKTGSDYVYAAAPWIPTPSTTGGSFRQYSLDLADAGTGVAGFDPTSVRSVGIAFESADCGGLYPPGSEITDGTAPPSTAIFLVDDITIEDAP